MKLPSIHQVYLEAKRAGCRFPFVLCCALAGVIAALVLIEKEPKQGVIFPVLFTVALGIPFFAALVLGTEKQKWRSGPRVGIQLLGLLLLVGYAFTVPTSLPQEPSGFFMQFALLAVGFVLLVMVLPYLKKGELNGFWQYNKTLYFRLFVTAIFSIVLFAGLAIALAALDNLFGVSVPEKRYGELWVLIVGLFSPWFFLSGVPEDLDSLDRVEEYPKGLKIFAQYVLLSLVIVYLLILYAYLLKILMQWSWPKGWVSSLILGFSAISILSLLLMHPIRNRSENAWIRAAGKWLYIVLIPLVVILFLAVMERIGDYGITESRYLGIALGIWLSAQVLYFLFSGSKSIKFTVVSLCLLAFLVSYGPWGMLGVSQRSQVERLSRLLVKNRILIDGKVRKEHGKVSREDAQEISSIVSYLYQVHGYGAIQSWFTDKLKEDTKLGYARNLSPSKVLDNMGVRFIVSRIMADIMNFDAIASKEAEDISGYDRLLRGQFLFENSEHRFDGDGISYVADKNLDSMSITIGNAQAGFNTMQVNLSDFAEKLLRDYGDAGSEVTQQMKPESMAVAIEQNGQKAKIFFQRLSLIRRNGQVTISSFTANIAYTVRK